MYFKLGRKPGETIFFNIFLIITIIVLLSFLFIDMSKNNIGEFALSAFISLGLLIIAIIDTITKLKNSWPMNLQVDERNQILVIFYSNNYKQALNFNEITNIEIDMKEGYRYSYKNLYINTANDTIAYSDIPHFSELLKTIVCLRKYLKIIYTKGSEKYFDKHIKSYDQNGCFAMPLRFLHSTWIILRFPLIAVIIARIVHIFSR